MARIYLASSSPRRRALLKLLGIPFRVVPSRAEEAGAPPEPQPAPGEDEAALRVRHWAELKAREAAAGLRQGLVVGADTVVVVDSEILGKPAGPAEARAMLARLSGRHHRVLTGVAVVDAASGRSLVECEETLVWFRRLPPREVEAYVATGEPLDKAGAYGIQGRGAALVERVSGCYSNVVGLPLARLVSMLGRFGVGVPEGARFTPAPEGGAGSGGASSCPARTTRTRGQSTRGLPAAPSRISPRRRGRGRGC